MPVKLTESETKPGPPAQDLAYCAGAKPEYFSLALASARCLTASGEGPPGRQPFPGSNVRDTAQGSKAENRPREISASMRDIPAHRPSFVTIFGGKAQRIRRKRQKSSKRQKNRRNPEENDMAKYIAKRILKAVPLLLLITVICFVLMKLAPYDAVDALTRPDMSQAEIDRIRESYGLNDPVAVQYLRWLNNLLHGNFGYSLLSHTSIKYDLLIRIPNTILLMLPSYLTAYLLSIPLGLLAGSRRGKWPDKLIDGFCSIGIATPTFWFAMLLIYAFGYRMKLLPILGMHTVGMEKSIPDLLRHFLLPYLVLIFSFLPDLTRFVRSSAIGQWKEDYVLVQKAFGAGRSEILFRHVARNVLIPLITKLGMALPLLVTGAVITETVFSWPGIGSYFVKAVQAMDYPIVMSVLVLSGSLVILGNLLSDILYSIVDPRIRST